MTNFEKVKQFMLTYGQEVKTKSEFSDDKTNKLRIDLIKEELEELTNAGVPPTVTSVVLSILNGHSHLFSHFENIVEALSGEA